MGFQADLHSTALHKLIKTKVPDNLLMKWTEYAVRENVQNNNVQLFQEWLEIQAKALERLQGEHSFLGTSAVKDQEFKTQNQTSLGSKQNAKNANILPKNASIVRRNIFWLIAPATRV